MSPPDGTACAGQRRDGVDHSQRFTRARLENQPDPRRSKRRALAKVLIGVYHTYTRNPRCCNVLPLRTRSQQGQVPGRYIRSKKVFLSMTFYAPSGDRTVSMHCWKPVTSKVIISTSWSGVLYQPW